MPKWSLRWRQQQQQHQRQKSPVPWHLWHLWHLKMLNYRNLTELEEIDQVHSVRCVFLVCNTLKENLNESRVLGTLLCNEGILTARILEHKHRENIEHNWLFGWERNALDCSAQVTTKNGFDGSTCFGKSDDVRIWQSDSAKKTHGGFVKWWYPQSSSISTGFSKIYHPFWVPPFVEIPTWTMKTRSEARPEVWPVAGATDGGKAGSALSTDCAVCWRISARLEKNTKKHRMPTYANWIFLP